MNGSKLWSSRSASQRKWFRATSARRTTRKKPISPSLKSWIGYLNSESTGSYPEPETRRASGRRHHPSWTRAEDHSRIRRSDEPQVLRGKPPHLLVVVAGRGPGAHPI